MMKRYIILACMATAAISCSAPKAEDPALTAVKAGIADKIGEGAKISMVSFEKIDSTTFGEEIDRRLRLQELAHSQNGKYAEKYKAAGQREDAMKKKAIMQKNEKIIAGLGQIKERMADSLDVVAYYDYKFSGKAEKDGAITEFNEYWASVTPDGIVLNITPKQKTLHVSLGRVIPGYSALLGKD